MTTEIARTTAAWRAFPAEHARHGIRRTPLARTVLLPAEVRDARSVPVRP